MNHCERMHTAGQRGLGRERGPFRDASRTAAARVGDPRLRQVELPVDERVPGWGHIGQVDRDLGVMAPPLKRCRNGT